MSQQAKFDLTLALQESPLDIDSNIRRLAAS